MAHNQNTNSLGKSAGYTPQGERHLPPADISRDIPCQLTGPGITRPTVLYVKPYRFEATVAKYAALGQTLKGPQSAMASIGPVEVRPPQKTFNRLNNTGRAVIDQSTGKLYLTASRAAAATGLSPQMVNYVLNNPGKTAKGRSFRIATEAEVEAAANDAEWRAEGPLVPMARGKFIKR